jgi:hypothetical protein
MEDLTGIAGQTIRFCYGQGYEAELGNGDLMYSMSNVKDTHLGGFNIDVLDDGTNFIQATLFRAQDITDGFKGLAVMPMLDTNGDGIPDTPNFNGVISRLQATTNLGGLWIGGVGFAREEENGLVYFLSLGASKTDPNGNFGPYGALMSDAPDMDEKDGYSIYAGVRIPTGDIGKIGFEYNYGSRYWFNFVQAQDDLIGPKLAARGHVGEAYYIFDVNPNMFIKIGGLYYDYAWTGSGVPVGTPLKIKYVTMANAANVHGQMPIVDKAYDAYASLTVKF